MITELATLSVICYNGIISNALELCRSVFCVERNNLAKNVKTWWESLPKAVQRISQLIAAVTVIGSACIATTNWVKARLTEDANNRIAAIEEAMEKNQSSTDLSLTRLELMLLIQYAPENTYEIEKVARHYFIDLGGNWYMASIYSAWAAEHDGDTSFVKE